MRKTIRISILGAVMASILLSCTADPRSIKIRVTGSWRAKIEEAGCVLKEAEFISSEGVMDLSLAKRFRYNAQFENMLPLSGLPTGGEPNNLRLDQNTIVLNRADVTVLSSLKGTPLAGKLDGKSAETSWSVPLSVVAPPAGQQLAFTTVIPERIAREWTRRMLQPPTSIPNYDRYKYQTTIVLQLEYWGQMADGTQVGSHKVEFPVTLCWGCLVWPTTFNPNLSADEQWNSCSSGSVPEDFVPVCNEGQDDYVPCGLYCKRCNKDESLGLPGCDEKFCPEL